MESRIAFIGITIENSSAHMQANALLQEIAGKVLCQTGLPYRSSNVQIISVILEATDEEIKSLADKLGRIPGVSVNTMLPVNSAKISLDKNSYAPGEKITITLTGATPSRDTIHIYKQGAPYNEPDHLWGSQVPTNNPFLTNAPTAAGNYEVRLHSLLYGVAESNLLATVKFTVEAPVISAKLSLDKNSYAPGEEMTITLTGATPISNTIYIFKQGAPYNGTDHLWGSDVPTNNPFSTDAPTEAGNYEVRLHSVRYFPTEANLMAKVLFTVQAPLNSAKISLDKNSYASGEEMKITLTGATPISNTIHIYKQGAPYNEPDHLWGSSVPTNNPFSTKAPTEAGDYEMRLHSVRYGVAESNLMTKVPFTVQAPLSSSKISLDKNSIRLARN